MTERYDGSDRYPSEPEDAPDRHLTQRPPAPHPHLSARTKARKRALDVVFEADQRSRFLLDVLADREAYPGHESPLPEYAVELVRLVDIHLARIDELIETYAVGWTIERMPAVDRALLRVATAELLDGMPAGVVISEALELAKRLSTDNSPDFINGVLGQIAHTVALPDQAPSSD